MKLPWQKTESTGGSTKVELPESTQAGAPTAGDSSAGQKTRPKGYTPPKGRPTPKRIEQEVKRGVVRDPSALPPGERSRQKKQLKQSMSKQEWKAYKLEQKEQRRKLNQEVQAKIDAGDERYLMERDKGDVRRFVRDWVDSRRFLSNWLMPLALIILILTFASTFLGPQVANIVTMVSLVFMVTIFTEGLIIGHRANSAVKAKFDDSNETGFRLGMYAFSRSTQPRKWRSPKPRVAAGASVS